MKLIDRTAVPVIKVSTKDTKKYTLHLDISFDGPGHHGLEAAQMISSMMNELPMLRPLVVVLKQFLIERSLLEAYTGTSFLCSVPPTYKKNTNDFAVL
jgi:DNA polymerase sigma